MNILGRGRRLVGLGLLSGMLAFGSFALLYNLQDFNGPQLATFAAPKIVSQSLRQADNGYSPAGSIVSATSDISSLANGRAVHTVVTPLASVRPTAVVASSPPQTSPTPQTESAELAAFSQRVVNGQPGTLCGLYAAGILALRVIQQPPGDASFISKEDGTATQFQKVDLPGSVGLLAHNTLAGRDFFRLSTGQELVLIYGDGRAEHLHVSEVADYQRLTLEDLRSDFLSLDTNQIQTADQVFAKFYQQAHRLTLQTCLKRGDVTDWGVHFVVADPNQPNP